MDAQNDLITALAPIAGAFADLHIDHYVGGSVASSFHGATRTTMDVDIVADLAADHVPMLVRLLKNEYYASETAMVDAVMSRTCFNLIHLATSFKVDVFVCRNRPFDRNAMQRAKTARLGNEPQIELRIATVEDSIISKLEWYRLSNETSDRQWNDVLRLRDLVGDAADFAYLEQAAASVNVADLLHRLMSQT